MQKTIDEGRRDIDQLRATSLELENRLSETVTKYDQGNLTIKIYPNIFRAIVEEEIGI